MTIRLYVLVLLIPLVLPSQLPASVATNCSGIALNCSIGGSLDKIRNSLGELQRTIDETKEFMATLGRFIRIVSSFISGISSVVGGRTLIFLCLLILISAGLRTIGVPVGPVNFSLSLFLADTLWFLWQISANRSPFSFIPPLAVINLTILLPFIIVALIRRYRVPVFGRFVRSLKRRLKFGIRRQDAAEMLVLIRHSSNELQKSVADEIDNCGKNDNVLISEQSVQTLDRLAAHLKKLRSRC